MSDKGSGNTEYVAFYERDDYVLTTLIPTGILLHHMPTGGYISLTIRAKLVWDYCDSAHSLSQIASLKDKRGKDLGLLFVGRVIKRLSAGRFINKVSA